MLNGGDLDTGKDVGVMRVTVPPRKSKHLRRSGPCQSNMLQVLGRHLHQNRAWNAAPPLAGKQDDPKG